MGGIRVGLLGLLARFLIRYRLAMALRSVVYLRHTSLLVVLEVEVVSSRSVAMKAQCYYAYLL